MEQEEQEPPQKMIPLENLDTLLKVVGVRGWFTLLFFVLMGVAAILWSVLGTLPITISGKSIAFDPDTSYRIRSEIAGFVRQIYVKPGDRITKGQVLAVVDPPELYWKLREQTLFLSSLERELEARKREGNPKAIVKKEKELSSEKNRLKTMEADSSPLQITSTVNGAVSWVDAVQGDQVEPDQILLWIHFPAAPESLKVLTFIPLFFGQQIEPGMEALTSIDTIDSEEYGMLRGVVKQVAPYPISSSDYYMQKIPSEPLRKFLIDENVPLVLIIIEPLVDPNTPSHLKWTSKSGPPCTIEPGVIGQTRITLNEVKPISFILPTTRKKTCRP